MPSRPSVALVLGAGGVAGMAYHAGTLATLARETGFDPRRADLVVGTSAGATTAAWLRTGLSADDLAAGIRREPLSEEGTALLADLPPPPPFPPPEGPGAGPRVAGRELPLPLAPWLVGAALLPLGRPRPVVALAGALPPGRRPTAVIGDRLRLAHPSRWPEQPTWICAVRRRDGHRIVLGRDDVGVPHLADAVEASSAVPGFFAPVTIGGTTYVDGGVHSTTNADLAAPLGFDVVVVVAPMTAVPSVLRMRRTRWGPDWGKALHSRVLASEVAAIRARGTPVVVFQPTAADLAARGDDVLDPATSAAVSAQAAASARDRLSLPGAERAVALLRVAAR